jgi:hypothetical protein
MPAPVPPPTRFAPPAASGVPSHAAQPSRMPAPPPTRFAAPAATGAPYRAAQPSRMPPPPPTRFAAPAAIGAPNRAVQPSRMPAPPPTRFGPAGVTAQKATSGFVPPTGGRRVVQRMEVGEAGDTGAFGGSDGDGSSDGEASSDGETSPLEREEAAGEKEEKGGEEEEEEDSLTASQQEVFDQLGPLRTKSGRPRPERTVKGDIFELESENALVQSGRFAKVRNTNRIIKNSAGIDHVSYDAAGNVYFSQSKGFDSDDQIVREIESGVSAHKFAIEIGSRTQADQPTEKAQKWQRFFDKKIRKNKITDPAWIEVYGRLKARKRGEPLEPDDPDVVFIRDRVSFGVTPDTKVPARHRGRTYLTQHSRPWIHRTLNAIPHTKTVAGSSKIKREEEAEYVETGRGKRKPRGIPRRSKPPANKRKKSKAAAGSGRSS